MDKPTLDITPINSPRRRLAPNNHNSNPDPNPGKKHCYECIVCVCGGGLSRVCPDPTFTVLAYHHALRVIAVRLQTGVVRRLGGCPSRSCIVSKQLNIFSNFFYHLVDPPF